MADYRAYFIDGDDQINGYEPLPGPTNDASAIEAAKRLVGGCDVELWDGARKVIRLKHQKL